MSAPPVALVTGANKGLGRETARRLAHHGYTVLLGSRDFGRGLETARRLADEGARVVPVELDVTEPASVASVADRVRRDHGRLQVLVNNAGVTTGTRNLATTVTDMRDLFEVNVFGVVGLVRALLPLLRESRAPRIVNVSSTTASLALTGDGRAIPGETDRRLAYASSKAALNMLTLQYARAFQGDPALAHIKINAASPGFTATDMNGHRGTRTVAEGARIIVELATLPDDGPTGGFFHDEGPLPW
ncbi:SDR family oxidoreductase [Streptomyces sp. NPDC088812]|uniref:SDR family oxidoreductase n=1 Tax=Streptomyces sp. NPDC088812 TaxID=3365905 RepID=UPI00380A61CB